MKKIDKLVSLLDEIIDDNFKESNSGGRIKFIDTNQQSKCKCVEIKTSQKIFAFSLDIKGNKPFNCFNNSKELYTKKNDGIIFCEYEKKLLVLLIELKSDNPAGYKEQLKADRNFTNYLIEQINTFADFKYDKDEIIFRYILFRTQRETPMKGTTAKKLSSIKFEDIGDDMYRAILSCNTDYQLQQIKDGI